MSTTVPTDSVQTLRALAPGVLAPEQHSARAELVSWLESVDHVQVREAVKRVDGKRYVIDVFTKTPESRIPTARSSLPESNREPAFRGHHAPDVTTERRFSEFSKLLNDLYSLAKKDHGFLPCSFCPPIVDYVFQDHQVPNRSLKWLHSDASVCAELTAYLNNLIKLVGCVPRHERPNDCVGVTHAPQLMKRFLCGDDPVHSAQ